MNRLDHLWAESIQKEVGRLPFRHRSATPSGPSLLRVSGKAGIAIAAFAALYFVAQLARAAL
jgi:hypothetical protein